MLADALQKFFDDTAQHLETEARADRAIARDLERTQPVVAQALRSTSALGKHLAHAIRAFTGTTVKITAVDSAVTTLYERSQAQLNNTKLLAGYACNAENHIKLESRLYIDVATKQGGEWRAQRKITVRVRDQQGAPLEDISVKLTLTSNQENYLKRDPKGPRALLATSVNASPQAEIVVDTDEMGYAEFIVTHPAKWFGPVGDDMKAPAITIIASPQVKTLPQYPVVPATLTLTLARNHQIATDTGALQPIKETKQLIEQIAAAPDHFLIQQREKLSESEASEIHYDLQDLLNDTVSRHQGIADFKFIEPTGFFDEPTRKALEQYLTHFKTLDKSKYGYDLSKIGPDPNLLAYLKSEYAPFDPDDKSLLGAIVDRRLLIGDALDTLHRTTFDGLWELYYGVVLRFQDEMVRHAAEFLNANEPWLHRPSTTPYQQGKDKIVKLNCACHCGIQDDSLIKTTNSPPAGTQALPKDSILECVNDTNTQNASFCDVRISVTDKAGKTQIREVSVAKVYLQRMADDEIPIFFRDNVDGLPQNRGNLNGPGIGGVTLDCYYEPKSNEPIKISNNSYSVPYLWGGKQSLQSFKEILSKQTDAVSWLMYPKDKRPDNPSGPNNEVRPGIGIDCSGFIQWCLTHSKFPDGKRMVKDLPHEQVKDMHSGVDIIALMMREIPAADSKNTPAALLIQRGDMFFKLAKHIVMFEGWPTDTVANQPGLVRKKLKENSVFSREAMVINAFGQATRNKSNKEHARGDESFKKKEYNRKVVRMPMWWWSVSWNDIKTGKVYLWEK